jgi:hypothetical protein
MRTIIYIAVVDYTSPTALKRCISDLHAFCRVAQVPQPTPCVCKEGDSFEIDITALPEYTALLWLHLLCNLSALNHHYSVELRQLNTYALNLSGSDDL